MSDIMHTTLPSTEFKINFDDGTVGTISVHPDETLEKSLAEMLHAAGATVDEVKSVELLGELSFPNLD